MPIRIGTRRSPLALAQAREAQDALIAAHSELSAPEAIEIVAMTTTGDQLKTPHLWNVGGKGLFTKELDEALLRGDIDIAVHSMKDVPATLPEGLVLSCFLPAADPRDAWISEHYPTIDALPLGACVGTSSPRRRAQILRMRPDLNVVPLRGNIDTRLQKIAAGEVVGTLLAVAGLTRLGKTDSIADVLSTEQMLPAVAQGVIGIAQRADDAATTALLSPLNHLPTHIRVTAERGFLTALDGNCHTPLAALATCDMERARVRLEVLRIDSEGTHHTRIVEGPIHEAHALGYRLGRALR